MLHFCQIRLGRTLPIILEIPCIYDKLISIFNKNLLQIFLLGNVGYVIFWLSFTENMLVFFIFFWIFVFHIHPVRARKIIKSETQQRAIIAESIKFK